MTGTDHLSNCVTNTEENVGQMNERIGPIESDG